MSRLSSKELWQQAFDDYCFNNFGGREPEGREFDEAAEAADEAVADATAERLDEARQLAKDEGRPAPMMLTNNMVRALNKLFGISEEATEEFIKNHPSPFGD
jgi:hypothetical protein